MNWHSMTPSLRAHITYLFDIARHPDINGRQKRLTTEAACVLRWHCACHRAGKLGFLHSKRAAARLAHELAESARAPIDRCRSWADTNRRDRARSARRPDRKDRAF